MKDFRSKKEERPLAALLCPQIPKNKPPRPFRSENKMANFEISWYRQFYRGFVGSRGLPGGMNGSIWVILVGNEHSVVLTSFWLSHPRNVG